MTIIGRHSARPAEARAVCLPRRRRGRRDAQHRARRDGRPARPLQGAGRRAGRSPPASSPSAPAPPSATCASGSTRRPPAATSTTTPSEAAYSLRPSRRSRSRRGQPGVPARLLPDRARSVVDEPRDHRGRPHRRRRRLARARPRRPRRHRALLPPGLPRQPRRRVDPRARRRVAKLERGRPGRRRRLRPRRVDRPHGRGLPGLDVHRLRLPRRLDRDARRRRAAEAGVGDRVRFEVAPRDGFPGEGYDLVDLVRLPARHGRPGRRGPPRPRPLAPDGTWMIVEPSADDRVEDNLNPVGRAFYGVSTLLCTPASLAQDVGLALGAQAGEARLRDVVRGRVHPLPPRHRDAVQPGLEARP